MSSFVWRLGHRKLANRHAWCIQPNGSSRRSRIVVKQDKEPQCALCALRGYRQQPFARSVFRSSHRSWSFVRNGWNQTRYSSALGACVNACKHTQEAGKHDKTKEKLSRVLCQHTRLGHSSLPCKSRVQNRTIKNHAHVLSNRFGPRELHCSACTPHKLLGASLRNRLRNSNHGGAMHSGA
jgi:hypothetical protein